MDTGEARIMDLRQTIVFFTPHPNDTSGENKGDGIKSGVTQDATPAFLNEMVCKPFTQIPFQTFFQCGFNNFRKHYSYIHS